jgi:pimeloyl-ACP methyl ester carboxylesterase
MAKRGEALVRTAWRECARELRLLELPRQGLISVEASYAKLEVPLLRWSATAPLVLAGWSQGGLIAVMFALRHPDRVRQLVLLAPPLAGAPRSRWVPSGLLSAPFLSQMHPGSVWLRQFAADLERGAAGLPETDVLVALRDAVVPVASSLLPAAAPARYHCFGSQPVDRLRLPESLLAGYVRVAGVRHINLAFHPAVIARLRELMGDLVGSIWSSDPQGSQSLVA